MNFLKNFSSTIIFAIIALTLSFLWGMFHGPQASVELGLNFVFITLVLAVMEVSLSFDNAVVNASILKNWDPFWQKMFLTVGIIVAVFGMRLIFPIVIVGISADMSYLDVVQLALNNPKEYSAKLLENHITISAFGGMFLWLVFANFIFDSEREIKWLSIIETPLAKLGNIPYFYYFSALILLAIISKTLASNHSLSVFYAGMIGILTYAFVEMLGWFIEFITEEIEEAKGNAQLVENTVKGGIGGFLYLEVLDASFSFDGVVGAFAITSDIIIIMLGLAIGAMAVRCLTVYLVKQGTLDEFRYLEHGAMYAIGALAVILLTSSTVHLPEIVTGLIGVGFIGFALLSSILVNKKEVLN